uniref:Nucleosidase n=1 Tax=Thermosporothrix sp. COM3 TaxID=2490863 RepID=A0A455SD55_9CHLR|nr:nucleosidase [Thermosporothrix sp. COM3]
MNISSQHPLCAVMLTALPVEYQAVRRHLWQPQEEVHPAGTQYERGLFRSPHQLWEVGIVETRMGTANAAFETGRAIDYFKPHIVFFVGVAGGIKDVAIGDVVAATKIYAYESGKEGTSFQPRPEIGQSTYRLVQRAQAEQKKADWLHRLPTVPPKPPRVFVGAIAAGEKVIASTRSATWKFLKAQYGDALAVEMEGYGFLQAVHANHHVEALVIRGISDLINGKSAADASGSQELAALHASAFAFEVLSKLKGPELRQVGSEPELSDNKPSSKYHNQFFGSVQGLTIGDNSHITIHNPFKKKDDPSNEEGS